MIIRPLSKFHLLVKIDLFDVFFGKFFKQSEFRKRSIKRLHFTLIETLLVFSLIALIAGVVGINAQKALHNQRFKTEVAEFVDHLRLAQDLMLIGDTDVHFKIETKPSENAIYYWIETDKLLVKSFDKFVKKIGILKTVHRVSHSAGKDGLIDLKFFSSGTFMTSGNIQLSSTSDTFNNKTLIANVMLKGVPAPIYSTEKIMDEVTENNPKDFELTQSVMLEIQNIENQKAKTS